MKPPEVSSVTSRWKRGSSSCKALLHTLAVKMSDDAAARKKRQRHFWKWVTDTKKVYKSEVSKDFKTLNILRAEHSKSFPDLYDTKKSFSVNESVKEFHRVFGGKLRRESSAGVFGGESSAVSLGSLHSESRESSAGVFGQSLRRESSAGIFGWSLRR